MSRKRKFVIARAQRAIEYAAALASKPRRGQRWKRALAQAQQRLRRASEQEAKP